jgi:hypothetical protein
MNAKKTPKRLKKGTKLEATKALLARNPWLAPKP